VDGQQVPYELAYARWLTAWVLQLCADGELQPSEELRIAARGQHVERWLVPRNTYPEVRPDDAVLLLYSVAILGGGVTRGLAFSHHVLTRCLDLLLFL
jgi:hypothetical protein